MNTRVAVAEVIAQVLRGKSLSALLPEYASKVAEKDIGLFKELCFGTLRWYPAIELLLQELMQKPMREKEFEVQGLLACGLIAGILLLGTLPQPLIVYLRSIL